MSLEGGSGHLPLAGVILCCSALKPEVRDDIHKIATEMGARCTYDLTIENTHLIIGDSRTPKYKYVAKERPDVKVLLPSFVDDVRSAWMQGGTVDIRPLEEAHGASAFHGLCICLTGFSDAAERSTIIQKITDHGAKYDGDLSRHTTSHLIARSATGKKYQMAPQWDIAVVAEEWLHDSVERGMSLDESLYSLSMAPEMRGRDAWNKSYQSRRPSSGKRPRNETTDVDALGRRKLRRTMSSKLSGEHAAMWANIAAFPSKETTRESHWTGQDESRTSRDTDSQEGLKDMPKAGPKTFAKPRTPGSIFNGLTVYIHDFQKVQSDILQTHLGSNGAICVDTRSPPSNESSTETIRFLMLPASIPRTKHSPLPSHVHNVPQVTEWWLEACLHGKEVKEPSESKFYEPFYKGKISGFDKLKIASTGLETMERLNLSRAVSLLGGMYDETIQSGISVVIASKDKSRPNRSAGALRLGIPVVTLDWVWACIRSAQVVAFDSYQLGPSTMNAEEHDPADTFSFATMKTLSVPSGETERRISERTSNDASKSNPASAAEGHSSILCDDVQLQDVKAAPDDPTVQKRREALSPSRSQQDRQLQPLQVTSSQRLNSPTKPAASPVKIAESFRNQDEISSAKSEQINSALVAMLTEKKLTRQSSNHAEDRRSSTRRKRTGLGRAISNATDPTRNSRQNSPDKAEAAAAAEDEEELFEVPIPSQKLVYEERESRVRHQKLIAAIGSANNAVSMSPSTLACLDVAAPGAIVKEDNMRTVAVTRSRTRNR